MTASSFVSGLYVVSVIAAVFLAGAALSEWARSDVLDRALAGIIGATAVGVGVPLALGIVGALTWSAYLIVMVLVGAVSAIYLARHVPKPRVPAAWSPAGMLAIAVGTFLTVVSLVPTLHAAVQPNGETRRYHITNLVTWAHTHNIWHLPYQSPGVFTSTHPGNGELLAVGMLFATGRDQLVYTTFALLAAVCIIAAASIARDLGGRPDSAALTMTALIASPIVYGTQAHSLLTDVSAAAPLLAGVACLLRARREHNPRWIVFAGVALGLAMGAKYTVLFLAPVVALVGVLALRPRKQTWWLAPGMAFFAAPWLVRNWIGTGNPIFPQGLHVLGKQLFAGGSSSFDVYKATIASHVLARRWHVLGTWWHLLWHFWGFSLVLPVVAVAFAFFVRPRRVDRMLLAGLCVLSIMIYAVTPYTGAGVQGNAALMGANLRYLIPAALVGVSLAAVVIPSRVLFVLVGGAFAFDAYFFVTNFGFRSDLVVDRGAVVAGAVSAIVVCGLVMAYGRRTIPVQNVAYAITCAAVVLIAVSIVRIDSRERWTPLERLVVNTHSSHVAVLGSDDFRSVLGPDLNTQLEDVVGGRPDGNPPPSSGAQLAQEVNNSSADTLVYLPGTPGVPAGWKPPAAQWQSVGSTPSGNVYVRKTPPPAPAAPAPPSPSPKVPTAPTP